MTNYWKTKVVPKLKKIFDKNSKKTQAAAAEATKIFDESKEQYNKEFEDKKSELQPKVVEIYEACSVEVKSLIKEPKDGATLKKHQAQVHKFLDDLLNIEFPGAKAVCEACSKVGGPAFVPGPVLFVLEKVSTFVVTSTEEEDKNEQEAPLAATTDPTAAAEEEEKKEIVVEDGGGEIKEEKKDIEEENTQAKEEKQEESEAATTPPPPPPASDPTNP